MGQQFVRGYCTYVDIGSAVGNEVLAGFLDETDDDAVVPCNPAEGASPDVLVQWTPPQLGDYTIRVSSDEFDPVLGVASPDCASPTFACNNDCDGTRAGLVMPGASEPVMLVVEAADVGGGAFSLSILPGSTLACGGGQ